MLVFLQQVINGLAQGGIYSLIAIGWTTVFGIVGVINWTHGEIYMLGAYTGYFVTTYLGLPLIPALLISMAAGALIAMAVDQFGYKPLRKKGVLAATGFITALGISTILRYTANAVFTVNPKAYPQLVDQKLITICTISGNHQLPSFIYPHWNHYHHGMSGAVYQAYSYRKGYVGCFPGYADLRPYGC